MNLIDILKENRKITKKDLKERDSLGYILTKICNFLALREDEVITKCRKRELVFARQLFYYFGYLGKYSYEKMGEYLSCDRITVYHGVNKIRGFIDVDKYTQKIVKEIKAIL